MIRKLFRFALTVLGVLFILQIFILGAAFIVGMKIGTDIGAATCAAPVKTTPTLQARTLHHGVR
jgi:hypothetical protein